MHIAFVYGRGSELRPAAGTDRASGGTVTALFELSTRLAERGHEIDVFGRCDEPGLHREVRYHDRGALAAFGERRQPDALVVIPDGLPLPFPLRARARVLWTQDAFSSGDVALSANRPWAPQRRQRGERVRLYPMSLFGSCIDLVVATSHWRRRQLTDQMRLPRDRFRVISNGVAFDELLPRGFPRDRHRLVYTSQVPGGLERLLDLFPAMKAAAPQAELHVFCSDEDPASWPVESAAATPGVVWRGRLSPPALANELQSSAVMVYPCTFDETFSASVAEAHAAGLPVVASSVASLGEGVSDGEDGFLIDGDPRSNQFGRDFVQAVVKLLQNDALRLRMSTAGTAKAGELYDWNRIAERWEAELAEVSSRNESGSPRIGCPELLDPSLLELVGDRPRDRMPVELDQIPLRSLLSSYGYDLAIPGLSEAADVNA